MTKRIDAWRRVRFRDYELSGEYGQAAPDKVARDALDEMVRVVETSGPFGVRRG